MTTETKTCLWCKEEKLLIDFGMQYLPVVDDEGYEVTIEGVSYRDYCLACDEKGRSSIEKIADLVGWAKMATAVFVASAQWDADQKEIAGQAFDENVR